MTTEAVPSLNDPAEGADGTSLPPPPPNIVTLPDGNIVTLYPRVTTAIAVAVLSLVNEGAPSQAVMFGKLSEVYLDLGVMTWTYDEPITPASIREHLTVANGSVDVAEAADQLYLEEISAGPLAARLRPRSPATPTASSTLPTSVSGSRSRTHSARSSRNGTAGKRSAVRGR